MELTDFQVCDRDLSDAALSDYMKTEAIAVDTETMGLLPQRDRLSNFVTLIELQLFVLPKDKQRLTT